MEKVSIMSYLPEQQQTRLRELIKKYGMEIQQKQKYKSLYQKIQKDYEQLKHKYQKLQQNNAYLKAQISTSRMALSKAKQVFKASKSASKNFRFMKNNEFQQQQNAQVQRNSSTTKKDKFLENIKNKETQINSNRQYHFEEQEVGTKLNFNILNKPPNPKTSFQKTSYVSLSSRKSNIRNDAQKDVDESSFLNQTSTAKKQQIISLKKEIQDLTDSIKKKKRDGLPLKQKMRQCDQIKNRFMKSKEKKIQTSFIKSDNSDNQSQQIKQADILNTQKQRILEIKNSKLKPSQQISSSRQSSARQNCQKNTLQAKKEEPLLNSQRQLNNNRNQSSSEEQDSSEYNEKQYTKTQHKKTMNRLQQPPLQQSRLSNRNSTNSKSKLNSISNINSKGNKQNSEWKSRNIAQPLSETHQQKQIRRQNWEKSSIYHKKASINTANIGEIYQDSFYDIIKQLNDQ